MSQFGVIVLGVMGAIWGVLAIVGAGSPPFGVAAPIVIGLLIVGTAVRLGRHAPKRSPEEEKRIGRLIGTWSAAEGVAIGVGNVVLVNLGLSAEFVPLIAIIVGLHFVPLARGIPFARYYLAAALLTGAGAIGWIVEPTHAKWLLTGSVAAATLWSLACLSLIRMARSVR